MLSPPVVTYGLCLPFCRATRSNPTSICSVFEVTNSDHYRTLPSSYIPSLECFVTAKREILSAEIASSATATPTSIALGAQLSVYDQQLKYVNTLMKQIPAGSVRRLGLPNSTPPPTTPIRVVAPSTNNYPAARQGPFLFQPAPQELDGSEGGLATDIAYLGFTSGQDADEGETERLAIVLIAFSDGKVDVCFDVERVEARWDTNYLVRCLDILSCRSSLTNPTIVDTDRAARPHCL
jgi:nucleoporin NUP82